MRPPTDRPGLSSQGERGERSSVELAVAPHLPLLHQALLQEPAEAGAGAEAQRPMAGDARAPRVGAPRVQVAALLAALAASKVEEVCSTMLTLGTPGALVDLFLRHPNNNFLHAQVYAFVRNAVDNRAFRGRYAQHVRTSPAPPPVPCPPTPTPLTRVVLRSWWASASC